jgi:hypothetical protein
MNKKYFIKLDINGEVLTKTLKDWARENQKEFPKFEFKNNTSDIPTTQAIETHLIKELNFKRIVEGKVVYLVRNL